MTAYSIVWFICVHKDSISASIYVLAMSTDSQSPYSVVKGSVYCLWQGENPGGKDRNTHTHIHTHTHTHTHTHKYGNTHQSRQCHSVKHVIIMLTDITSTQPEVICFSMGLSRDNRKNRNYLYPSDVSCNKHIEKGMTSSCNASHTKYCEPGLRLSSRELQHDLVKLPSTTP